MADHMLVDRLPLCQICRWPASGAFEAEFSSGNQIVLLCAACGFHRAWATWHGHMTRRLKALRLVATLYLGDYPPPPPKPVPLSEHFERGDYKMVLKVDDQLVEAELGSFATEWAALERARQVTQQLSKQLLKKEAKPNHWLIQTGVARLALKPQDTNASVALVTTRQETQ